MNENIKASIESRKNAIFSLYEVKDDSKINNLFKKIEEFGTQCADLTEFETKFTTSELNNEYIALFTELSQSGAAKDPSAQIEKGPSIGEIIQEEGEALQERTARDAAGRVRGKARREVRSKMFDIPVVGTVMQGMQTASLFNKFKKKKPEVEEEIETENKE